MLVSQFLTREEIQYSCFSCSNVTKKITFHGPMRTRVGTKPLYNAETPSFFTVYAKPNINIQQILK